MSKQLLVRERISAVAFMSVNGILDFKIVSGNVNGDIYTDFVEEVLLPRLMPLDGRNPHSVVILDNCEEAVKMIQELGAMVHFLPPYSPDLNPIEEAFSKVKGVMKVFHPLVTVVCSNG